MPFISRRFLPIGRVAASLLCLAACASAPPRADSSQASAPKAFDRPAWLQDFAYLKAELERSYSHLAWFASLQPRVDLRALDRRALRALDTAESDDDAKIAIWDFVVGFHDGHLKPLPKLQPAAGAALNPPKVVLDGLTAAEGAAALGYSPASEIAFSLPFESLQGSSLRADGVSRVFRSSVHTTARGLRLGIVRIPRFREQDGPPELFKQIWETQRKTGKPLQQKDLAEAVSRAVFATLAAQLKQFQAEKVDAVLVDVGGNGGGNDFGDWATRLFTARDVHSARLLLAASPSAQKYLDEQLEGLRRALAEFGPANPAAREELAPAIAAVERRRALVEGRKCDLSWVWREQRPWAPNGASRLVEAGTFSGQVDYHPPSSESDRTWVSSLYWAAAVDEFRGAWTGPVYVLTDGGTGSSAEMFAATLRDNRIARTVGAPTKGAGGGWMTSEPPIELPHSHLRFQVPNCVRLRADGTDEVAGIDPDLPALPTEGEDSRARAARVLEAIAADLRSDRQDPRPALP